MSDRFTLSELQENIRDSLYLSLPGFYWVVAEISEMKQNYSGHCYLELIEKKSEDSDIKARVKGVIWGSRYGFIKSFFENTTGETLREGFKVLVKVKIEYHEIYGLSLVITDIDPAYTIGEMAAKRLQIIRRLEQEGVFDMNRELEIPLVPQRIAIVSSANAAGYTDLLNHLKGNSYKYVYYTALFSAVMQGTETEQSVINALDRIAEKQHYFDLVVIIRGGGSQTDLSWFDSYKIAYYVTQFPLPVLTGIGHEKDLSVTDLVACRSLKTPTAVADFIIEQTAETENYIIEKGTEIKELALGIIDENRERIENAGKLLFPLATLMISEINRKLAESSVLLMRFGKEKLYEASSEIDSLKTMIKSATLSLLKMSDNNLTDLKRRLDILDPAKVLGRGYTITTRNGRILKSVTEVSESSLIETRFIDGIITSTVNNKKNLKE